jgi:hypothetical protein
MRYAFSATVAGLALAVSACGARGQVHVGAGVDYAGLDHIEMAVGDVYGMPVGPLPSYIYPDELPVVYLLAREAGVSPEVVMALREQGWSWLDITYHLGVDPYVYVAHLPRQRGYWGYPGRHYGYLTDRHIIDYVNLALWASYHRRPVTQLIIIRQRVPTWTYYVHYHAPRVVFVHNTPKRWTPRRWDSGRRDEPRRAEPRRAEPRDGTPRQAALPRGLVRPTEQQAAPRTMERSAIPSRPTTHATRPVQPTRPAAQPTRPAAQPTRPAAQPTRPAAQPTRPAAQPTRPAAQPTRPAAQPTRPAAQPTRPAAQPTRPAAQPTRPAAQPTRPAAQPTRPAAQPTRPAARPSRPAAQPTRPAAQPSRPAAQSSRPSSQSSRPSVSRPSSGSRGESASTSRGSTSSSRSDSRGSRRGG